MINRNWTQWEQRRAGIERKYLPLIQRELSKQVQAFISHINWNGLIEGRLNLDHVIPVNGIQAVIKALYIKSGLLQANNVYGDLKRSNLKFSGFGFNEQWTRDIENYFQLHILNKAVLPITGTTKNMIREILEKASREGWGVEQTVKEIISRTQDINRHRARVITRTESVRAMNVGTLLGADKSSIVLDKQWITARDERVRSSHRYLQGVKIEMEDVFANGCAFPGDPNGSAKETINCRCTIALVPKRDASGRVVRKPKVETGGNAVRVNTLNQVAEGIAAGFTIGTLISDLIDSNN